MKKLQLTYRAGFGYLTLGLRSLAILGLAITIVLMQGFATSGACSVSITSPTSLSWVLNGSSAADASVTIDFSWSGCADGGLDAPPSSATVEVAGMGSMSATLTSPNQASGTGTGTVSVPAGTADGKYDVKATLNNGRSDTKVQVIGIDKTPPTITFVSRTPPNANGWNNTNVTVKWNCADTLSGATTSTITSTLSKEGANRTTTANCHDQAGNTASDTQSGINIDKTSPSFGTPSRAPGSEANPNGWNNADVTVNFPCIDALSGPATATIQKTVNSEGAGQTASASSSECIDLAGNTAVVGAGLGGINIDKTAPSSMINAGPAEGSFTNNTSTSFTFGSSDALSGVDALQCRLDSAPFANCTSPQLLPSLSEGAHTFQVRATDRAGNVEATATRSWTVDLTPPVITPLSVAPVFVNANGTLSLSVNVTDASSGVALVTADCDTGPVMLSNGGSGATYAGICTGIVGTAGAIVSQMVTFSASDAAGNSSNDGSQSYAVDREPPVTTTVSGPSAFTNNADPGFSFAANDGAGSGLASSNCTLSGPISISAVTCSNPFSLSSILSRSLAPNGSEDGAYGLSIRSTDNAGNLGSTATYTWIYDSQPPNRPIVTISPAPNREGWNKTDVTVNFSSDGDNGPSGVAGCSSSTTLTNETASMVVNGTCTDLAGNISTTASALIKIDKTAPSSAINSGPAEGSFSNQTSATFVASGSDALSGIDFLQCSLDGNPFTLCTGPQALSDLSEGTHIFRVRAIDNAGNIEETATRTWKIDLTPPRTTLDIGEPKVNNESTFVRGETPFTLNCSDTFSGCAATQFRIDGGAIQTGVNFTLDSLAEGIHTIEFRSIDIAGNVAPFAQAPAPMTSIIVDNTPPMLTILSPPDGATFEQGASITARFSASDVGSGVDSVIGTAANGAPIDTNSVGAHEFTVTASDRLDNSSSLTHRYRILFLPPSVQEEVQRQIQQNIQEQIDKTVQQKGFKSGDTIKLCFEFKKPRTAEIIPNVLIWADLVKVLDAVSGKLEFIRFLGNFALNAQNNHYCLEFATVDAEGRPLLAGLYKIEIFFNDGTSIQLNLTLG